MMKKLLLSSFKRSFKYIKESVESFLFDIHPFPKKRMERFKERLDALNNVKSTETKDAEYTIS